MLRTLIDLADADLAVGARRRSRRTSAPPYLVDDEDLALARGLVGSLLARDGRGDPLTELSAPELPVPAGLAVHAVIGSCAPEAVRRAMTAAVAAGLAGRSRRRVRRRRRRAGTPGAAPRGPGSACTCRPGWAPPSAGCGWRPASTSTSSAATDDGHRRSGAARAAADRRRRALARRRARRGPGTGAAAARRAGRDARPHRSPCPSGGRRRRRGAGGVDRGGRLVLHDATAFGIRTARWVVDLSDTSPLLPEARALLGEVAAQLASRRRRRPSPGWSTRSPRSACSTPPAASTSTTLADAARRPGRRGRAALGDATRTASLAAGLRSMVGDGREAAGSSVQLRAGDVTVTADLAALHARRLRRRRAGSGRAARSTPASPSAGPALELSAELGAGGDLTAARPAGRRDLGRGVDSGGAPRRR